MSHRSAEWLWGAVEALGKWGYSHFESVQQAKLEYRDLLAEAEAREASVPTAAEQLCEWARFADDDAARVLRFGAAAIRTVTAQPTAALPAISGHGVDMSGNTTDVPTAAEVKAQIIAEYIDDNGMKCDCCQHVMIDVTASKSGEKQHCIAGDPEGEGSGCAWGWIETAEQKQLALEKAAEVIAACERALGALHKSAMNLRCVTAIPSCSNAEQWVNAQHAVMDDLVSAEVTLAAIAKWKEGHNA